ncbi:LOW QUALITY PROTEIN: hypothetical protein OSB04_028688 [Centaurea solstitialis]|uniref:Integrase catalytic domain-containing protein n=1 Tax=Centaurea solstitialis TaxID=347529 RepID=A0AA38VY06_9ASTR|nr:LOW QUALITY PROTEIN: hypothetical protein OSB04_028688 [Centaurea solstitialis]
MEARCDDYGGDSRECYAKSTGKKSYCLVIVDDYSRFTWVYFLRTKDETSGLIKPFVIRMENKTNLRVKVIRSDNGTEFKNADLNSFCEEKGIERQYSAPKTPQQNGVAERRNRTLIEAARTMLVDSKLPITFWAEAVNTACYVQNRVLIVKSKGKTPYELFEKKKPYIGFLKPFGCPCTILDTKTHLGKFESKSDDGFLDILLKAKLLECSITLPESLKKVTMSNAMRTPNIPGSGPNWLFNIDSLTNSLNMSSAVITGSGTEQIQETSPPFVMFSMPLTDTNDVCTTDETESDQQKEPENVEKSDDQQTEETSISDNIEVIPALDEGPQWDQEPEVNDSNLGVDLPEEPLHLTRTQKNHPPSLVIGDIQSPMITRKQSRALTNPHSCMISVFLKVVKIPILIVGSHDPTILHWETLLDRRWDLSQVGSQDLMIPIPILRSDLAMTKTILGRIPILTTLVFLSQTEPKKALDAMKDPSWIEAMQEELLQFVLQHVWDLVDLPRGHRVIGTKWIFRNKTDERGIVIKNKARLHMDMETHKHLTADVEGEEVDVHNYRSMIGSLLYLTASRPDIMFAVCVCARYQVRPKESHLHAVKRIFKYLKGQPRLGLWYPNDSSFDLVAYTDSDYGGANLDRKSTSGGCQFLGGRLVSWQCKKQTTVSQSTTETEYIAASQCCSQTPIYIDNNSAISIVNNPVKHSKTKHIEIKYHFIRDCNEKKLIQVLKVHTDDQYADLFTKAFDVGRFTFLVTSVGMMNSE